MKTADEIIKLFDERGHSDYGGEEVTQLEHALQCAALAEKAQASDALVIAALLHDIGHLLHDLPQDAPEKGIDDRHENSGYHFLRKFFPDEVTEPVRLHVAAKRYLCTVDSGYFDVLSEPSVVSFRLQGGKMSPEELQEFEANPHHEAGVQLRRWDDEGKDPNWEPPPLSHYQERLKRLVKGNV